ncbi:hypothetical protein ACSXAF_15305 (plasmid) [Clostridium perfringens]
MTKKKKIIIIIISIFIIFIIGGIYNKFGNSYENLNDVDKSILNELDKYCKANNKSSIWPNFKLENKTILAVNGRLRGAYIINPQNKINSLFVQKINMPDSFSIKVYRISALAPQLLSYKIIPGNFNNSNKTYSIFGNELYYTRYGSESFSKKICDSSHYLTFLSHESFHYYMQNNWKYVGRFDTEILTKEDLDLLETQYKILTKIQKELKNSQPNRDNLLEFSKEYVNIVEKRIKANPQYTESELMAETEEGTAMYISIKSSKIINYDFDIMKFSLDGINSDEIYFDIIIPAIKNGKMNVSTLASDWIYQTGAQLCMLLDELEVHNWKEKLNTQTEQSPVTLYSLLKAYINN